MNNGDRHPLVRETGNSVLHSHETHGQIASSVPYDRSQNMSSYAQPLPVGATGYSAIPPPALATDPVAAHMYMAPHGAVLYGSSYAPYQTYPDGNEVASTAGGGGGGGASDGNVIVPAPISSQAPPSAYAYSATPSAHPYSADANINVPSAVTSAQPYMSSTPSFYPMAPPPMPRPPTASSSRSATGAVRHRGRAGRMLSRAREHIDDVHGRSGSAEVHWSEVDAEGTWVLMFVPSAQRGYE
ncbi:hypothetical protein PENSPDRAFT_685050 [Peniophora sp. CONT]|nr:hypothetical protein PENSPDRAFT_685050 [Peniophora sp. CONT]